MKASLLKLIALGAVALGAVALVGTTTSVPLHAADPTAVGLWEQVDENSNKPESWFKITERNGMYEGNLVKIFFKPGEDENWVCSKCEGSEKGAPVLGLTLIKGMKRNGMSYEEGTIMDPRDGSVYRALMRLSPDGQKLEVRGYLGISLFGRSQVWNRLPDNALAAGDRAARKQGRGAEETIAAPDCPGLTAKGSAYTAHHPRSITPASPPSVPKASEFPVALQASAVTGASPGRRASTSAPSSTRTSSTRPSA